MTGAEHGDEAGMFQEHRAHLERLAYRMLGSRADAEDVVQEAYLRFRRRGLDEVREPRAFLSATVTRLSLDRIKSARARREAYVGPWLPEPILGDAGLSGEQAVALAEDVSLGLMIALERLSPLERAAFLLREAFDADYAELSRVLERSEEACRQLVMRARTHVREARPRFQPSRDECEQLVTSFVTAASSGDLEGLRKVLADQVVFYSDGGGHVKAALHPIRGVDRVVRFILGVMAKFPQAAGTEILPHMINGSPGLVVRQDGVVVQTLGFDIQQGLISALFLVSNPEKLTRVG